VPDPKEGDVLTAIASASDDDLDTVTMLYGWFVNGVQASPSPAEQLDSTHFDKGDSIYVVLTPSDGSDEGTPVTSNTVTAVNTAPLAVSAALDPTEGTEETTFLCAVSGWQDPDPADSESYGFQWYVNGVTSVTTATLDGASFQRGDTLRCEATPNDGEDTGSTLVSSVVTVDNTLPSISSVTIDPTAGDEGTTFTCLPAGWVDPDPADATPDYSFQWYVGAAGSELASVTTETIDGASFDRDDSIYCEVTPINEVGSSLPAEAGTPLASASLVVANTVPQITSASIDPTGATTSDTLYAYLVGWTDADGDGADYLYQWWIESPSGSVANGGTDWALASTEFVRGDSITLEVTPTDGTDSGTMVTAGPVVIANTSPGAPVVSASPGSPQSSDDLVCSIATESADPDVDDGIDSLSYDFEWLDDNGPSAYVLLAGTASSTLNVPSAETNEGDTWTCEVTSSDSEGAGTSGSSLLVINTPPSPPTVSISTGPTTSFDLVCSVGTPANDPDGDPLSYDFDWLDPSGNVAYSLAGGTDSDTLSVPASVTTTGDVWTCRVSASDGLVQGPADQATVTVSYDCSGLSLDGNDDYVEVPHSSDLTLASSDYTIEWWMLLDGAAGGDLISKRGTGSQSGYTVGAGPTYLMAGNGCCGGGSAMYFNDSTSDFAPTDLSSGWHHVALTHDTSELESTFWFDGEAVGVSTALLSLGANTQTLWFGREHVNTSEFEEAIFGGVQMSDTVLYTETFVPSWPLTANNDTVALWPMLEGEGSTVFDISGSNHDGTIHGGATWGTSCPGEDLDSDGTPAYEDCDDEDPDSPVRTDDRDCDGVKDVITAGGLDLVAVPAGTFEMGCTAGQSGCQGDESPAHTVTLSRGFWMGETEITQGQWLTQVGNSPASFSSCGADCPVESVGWYDALSFANSVSVIENIAPCYDLSACSGSVGSTFTCSAVGVNSPSGSGYDCEGYRLPTEAEWEYAARAGNDLLYAGSNVADDVAWHSGNTSSAPEAVGLKLPNAYGLYDMSGNVFEWTWDLYSNYSNDTSSDPEGPTTGSDRVSRGGAWNNPDVTSRLANRDDDAPGTHEYETGLRIVRSVPIDADGDGALMYEDCDDNDADLGNIANDATCDGVEDILTADGIDLMAVPAGTFEMGCTSAQQSAGSCGADESPAHSVTLSRGFWMGKTEVTQGQWLAQMSNSPSNFSSCGGDCPVESISWHDTLAFANAASISQSLDPCYDLSACSGTAGSDLSCSSVGVTSSTGSPYDCDGYRLPTEAEWEYAARAGTDLLYSGSDVADDVAWHAGNTSNAPQAVGQKLSNDYGLYDMSGNVWEWTWDWYGSYSSTAETDPEGPSTSDQWVTRGGGYNAPEGMTRISQRGSSFSGEAFPSHGFRIARTVLPEPPVALDLLSNSGFVAVNHHADLNVGLGDFAIEYVLLQDSVSQSGQSMLSMRRTGENYLYISSYHSSAGWTPFINFTKAVGSSWNKVSFELDSPIPHDTWTHLVIQRRGGTLEVYVNGVAQPYHSVSGGCCASGDSDPGNYPIDNTGPWVIGVNTHTIPSTGSGDFQGQLAGLQYTAGSPYTGNFSVTYPLPTHANSVVNLLLQDGSGSDLANEVANGPTAFVDPDGIWVPFNPAW